MSTSAQEIDNLIGQKYKEGFVTELEVDTFPPGLDEEVIAKLSAIKELSANDYRSGNQRLAHNYLPGHCIQLRR
jgi:hypothetical protein